MGVTKTELFNDELNHLATLYRILGHPGRLSIIQMLHTRGTATNGELVQAIGLTQPTVSGHLRELKDAGIVSGSPVGPTIVYRINEPIWNYAKRVINEFMLEN